MKTDPFISVIIPTKGLSYYLLHENLPSFEHQTYKEFEVIVLPNEHTRYDLTLLKKYSWLRIIPTGTITRPAMKRDIGVKQAKGTIIAFIDDDAYPQPEWLQTAARVFQQHDVAAVCGPGILPPSATVWEKIFDEVLKTSIGVGGYTYRFMKGHQRFVDDYPSMNFLIKKNLFEKVGGFNNDYWPGEDSKLCNDLVHKEHERILYIPDVTIYHHRRTALKPYLRQHGSYGYHRGAFFAHGDQNSRRIGYIVPSLLCIYMLLLIVDLLWGTYLGVDKKELYIIFFPLFLYFVFGAALMLSSFVHTRSLKITLGAPITLFSTHVYYGIMFLKGLMAGYTKRDKIYN